MQSLLKGALAVVALAAGVGCAGKEQLAKQLDDLKREVVSLRASQAALRDRLDGMEAPVAAAEDADDEGEAAAAEPDDRPKLDVVTLSPQQPLDAAPEAVAPPVDEGPPIVIRGDESGVEQVEAGAPPPAKPPVVGKFAPKQAPKGR